MLKVLTDGSLRSCFASSFKELNGVGHVQTLWDNTREEHLQTMVTARASGALDFSLRQGSKTLVLEQRARK